MLDNKRIAVVVPCFNEEHQVKQVFETIPDLVDEIVVVDDKSTDQTVTVVLDQQKNDSRIVLIQHSINQGVGAAIASGYKHALANGFDIAVVMAGDAQMDPDDLPNLIQPVINGDTDYAKGNRLFTEQAWHKIPKIRYLGNAVLSLLTKIASGYWHVADSQCGYTAVNREVLETINWDKMYKRYGQPNDLLVRLNIHDFRVRDISVTPVYDIGEKSGLKPLHMIPKLSWLITRMFFYRMLHKYVIKDFHPLVFFYLTGLTLLPLGTLFGIYLLFIRFFSGPVASTSAMFAGFLTITGLQFLLFAMFFDMESNKHLK